MRAVELVVNGRVQGVYYRATARDEADRLGLAGWIRNREDGAVVARIEGSPEAVEEFVAWSRQGPPAARVDEVEISEVTPQGDAGFDVLH